MFKGISEGKFPAFSRKTTENVSVYKIYVSIYNFVFEKWYTAFQKGHSGVSERDSGKRRKSPERETGNKKRE